MALLNFPTPGSIGEQTTQNGNTWQWNGTSWVAFNSLSLSSQVSGILAVQYGGTGFGGTFTKGDLLYASSSNTFTKLAAGTAGSVLASTGPGGDLYWKLDAQGAGTVGAGTANELTFYDTTSSVTSATGITLAAGTKLTIGFGTSSSSTTTGAFIVYGGVGIGGSLWTGSSNFSSISGVGHLGGAITSGVWSGTAISLSNGGTNGTASGTAVSYQLAVYNSTGTAITQVTSGTASSVLFQSNASTAPSWVAQSTLVVGGATTSANLQGGSQYNLVYQSNANTTGFITNAAGSGASVLTQTTGNAPVYLSQSQLFVGGATTATQWQTARTVTFSGGGVTGSFTIDGSANVSGVAITVTDSSIALGQKTTGQYASTIAISGNGITATTAAGDDGTAYTIYSSATSANTASAIVQRDASNNFSAGTITASLSGLATSATKVGISTVINSNTVPLTFSDVQQPFGALGSTTLISAIANTGAIIATTFIGNLSGTAVTATHYGSGANLSGVITSVTASTGINVTGSGAITVGNTGVLSLQGTANQVLVNGGSGSATTGAITLTLPQSVGTGSTPSFTNLTLSDGASSTLATVGSQPTSMVNKQYVDNLASGLDIHGSVRVIQTGAALAANYVQTQGAGSAATGAYLISTSVTALPAIDGVTITGSGISQRVLINGGFTGTASIAGTTPFTPTNSNLGNGIYYVAYTGIAGTNWMLIRATDTDDNTELTGGTFTFVEEGNVYADSGWVCSNDTTNFGAISIGSTAITFTQFTGGGALSVGQGLTKVGNTIGVNANITSAGSNTAGKWDTLAIGGALTGVAGTAFYPTFQIKTEAAYTGTGTLILNNDGFSLTGSTGTNRTLTVTGSGITLTGGGFGLTLTGSISLPAPTANGIAYGASSSTVAFLTAAGSGASVLTQTSGSAPVYLAQSQLVVGGANTAASWQTARTVTFSGGGVTGSFSIDGSANVTGVAITVTDNSIALGQKTTGNYAGSVAVSGSGVTIGGSAGEGTDYTIYIGGTSLNTASTLVFRDASNNFSAGTITANLTGTASIASSAAQVNLDATTSTRYLIGTANNTASASTQLSTGSGITIGNNYLTSGAIAVTNTTASTSSTTGALIVSGGAGIALTSYFGQSVVIQGSTASTSPTSGALVVTGGVGIGGSLWTSATNFSSISGVGHQNGAITSGVWSGTAISLSNGGTNGTASGTAVSYQLAVYNATGLAITQVTSGTASSVLFQSNASTAPSWVAQSTLIVGGATTSGQVSTGATTVTNYLLGTPLNTASSGGTLLFTGSGITIGNNYLTSGGIAITNNTGTAVTTGGALIVTGGVGIGGSLWTTASNFSSISGVSLQNGVITSGVWSGTAISTSKGGTGLITVSANQVLIGASTGNTWTGIGSSSLPVVGIGTNPPSSPGGAIGNTQSGQLWWDSTYGVLKVYYDDGNTLQWVDATPVLGSSGGASAIKRSYLLSFGAGFTPSTGPDTISIQVPYAPDNSSQYYYIKRLDYRHETAGTGVQFYIERHNTGNASFSPSVRIHTAGSGTGASFVTTGAGIFITSYTLSSTGASFVSSSGVAGSVISGDYLRLNFTAINSAANMSISMVLEEQ